MWWPSSPRLRENSMRSIDRRRAIFPGRDRRRGGKKNGERRRKRKTNVRGKERDREREKKRGSIERRNENRLIVARSGLTVFQSGSSAWSVNAWFRELFRGWNKYCRCLAIDRRATTRYDVHPPFCAHSSAISSREIKQKKEYFDPFFPPSHGREIVYEKLWNRCEFLRRDRKRGRERRKKA